METNSKKIFKDIKRWGKDKLVLHSTICEYVLNVQSVVFYLYSY